MRDIETLCSLIGSGEDVDVRGENRSALYLAAQEGYLDVVGILLENGAGPNVSGMGPHFVARGKADT